MVQIHIPNAPSDKPSALSTCGLPFPPGGLSNPQAVISWPIRFREAPDLTLVVVRVMHAASVAIVLSNGSEEPLEVIDGYALAAIPDTGGSIPPASGQPPVAILAKDAEGNVTSNDPLMSLFGSD